VDKAENVYVSDRWNSTIRKITPDGVVTTLAGLTGNSGCEDGLGEAARFHGPSGLAVDDSGNVYVADTWNHRICKIASDGLVTTLAGQRSKVVSADGPVETAGFFDPTGVAVDRLGNVYVADDRNQAVRKITSDGMVTTLAGLAGKSGDADGNNDTARFHFPHGVAGGNSGDVYVADTWNGTVRRISPNGVVTTLGSGAKARAAVQFGLPHGIAVDGSDNVYVVDQWNCTICKISPDGEVTILAGSAKQDGSADGSGNAARLRFPYGLAVDHAGNLYVGRSGEQHNPQDHTKGSCDDLRRRGGVPWWAEWSRWDIDFSKI
jgi:secreted PhoX family phosphatase